MALEKCCNVRVSARELISQYIIIGEAYYCMRASVSNFMSDLNVKTHITIEKGNFWKGDYQKV